jgi:choline dehydrogenase-like flavoprotein
MILSGHHIPNGAQLRSKLIVVGAGPAGIVSALEASRRGIDVIVVETGNLRQRSEYQQLSVARMARPDLHAPVELAVSRQVGGTSSIWGGRCVPYDPIDFVDRALDPASISKWPLEYSDLLPYFGRACDWMICGRSAFDVAELPHLPEQMIAGLEDGEVRTSSLERWSLPTNFGKVYFNELRSADTLRVITDATCVRLITSADHATVTAIECRTLSGRSFTVTADDVIVASGGLEATRLLMCSPGAGGRSLGDHSGHLGHWYMAHLEGAIAHLVLAEGAQSPIYWYERDIDGAYVRRRFTFRHDYLLEHGLPNIAGWIANPELADASHHDPQLSFTYLALISPMGRLLAPTAQRLSLTGTKIPGAPYGTASRSPVRSHTANLLRQPTETIRFAFDFGLKRLVSRGRRPPGFFVGSTENRYPFQYHAEHAPHYESCVRLTDDIDEIGMRRLEIDIRFTDDDFEGVVAAHRHWDAYLRASRVGRLEYSSDDLRDAVRARSGGGFHQVGTTRMSKDPADGVVDESLAVHGVSNLYVASSSVFVTSGQANSTFMVVAFAVRLVDHLYGSTDSGG